MGIELGRSDCQLREPDLLHFQEWEFHGNSIGTVGET